MKTIIKLLCILAILVSFTVKTQATTIDFSIKFDAVTSSPGMTFVIKAQIVDYMHVFTSCTPVPIDIQSGPGTYSETCSVTIPTYGPPNPAKYFILIVTVERYIYGVPSGTATGYSGWQGYSTGTITIPTTIVATPSFP